ncbi:pYEATS domain-containing protein [Pseudomonas sp. 5C2]|uniref:pYEATS domain-containing protein n=1 Tax=Pseudomonas sp. 5C2 TaxID=3048588 RepID=UPI003A101207
MPSLGRILGPDDDPNLGRFGGQSSLDGFHLTATFEPTETRDWVTIILTLEAERSAMIGIGDFAWFLLHPTFSPSAIKVTFRGNRAQLRLQAWGGFTVGVWLPKTGVELECNLAVIESAPEIIKTR